MTKGRAQALPFLVGGWFWIGILDFGNIDGVVPIYAGSVIYQQQVKIKIFFINIWNSNNNSSNA